MSASESGAVASTIETVWLSGVNAVRLRADFYGPRPPRVLFLHGGGQTRHAWRSTCLALSAAGISAVSVDVRGHGDSDWDPTGEYRLPDMVGDVGAVLRYLGQPVVIVGASLGGVLGLLAAAGQVRPAPAGLVLVDVAPRIEDAGAQRITAFMASAPNGFASLAEAADRVANYLPHRPKPPSPEGLRKNLREDPDGRWRWRWDPAFLTSFVPRDRERRTAMLAAARRLELPTLLVHGTRSDVVGSDGVAEFRDLVPHADYVRVADARHMVAGDENDAFTVAVTEFVRRALDGSGTTAS